MAGKISELTARAVANLGAATTALEVTTNLTTTPVSGYVTAGTLLQWMMANITTDVAVNTNKFQITAATGNVGVGGAAAATAAILVQSTGLTGVTQYAVNASAVFNGATTAGKAIYAGVRTAAAAFTMVTGYGAHIYAPSIGAGSAITTLYGIYVDNQGAAGVTNAYGLYLAAQSGAATINRGFYNGGDSQLVGTVGIGATPSTDTALYIPITTLATSSQYGIYVAPTFNSAGTTAAYDVFAKVTTAAAAYTLTSGHAFFANTPTIGAGSAITNQYGIRINNQGTTGVTNAYGVYIEAQSGAATTNIGLYNIGTSRFDGAVAIGSAPNTGNYLTISGNGLTGTGQYGIYENATFTSAATSSGAAVRAAVLTSASAFTMSLGFAYYADVPTLGAGSAITTQYGFYAANQGATGVTNAYGIYVATQSGAATTNIGIRNDGSLYQVNIAGFGITPDASIALAMSYTGLTGTTQTGISNDTSFSSAATSIAYGYYGRFKTNSAAWTLGTGYAMHIAAPSINATAVTTLYGMYIGNQGQAKSTTAYGLYIATPTVSTTCWALAIDAGQVYFRSSALATNATVGHVFIPTSAGAPTGVPASIPTGQVAFQYDSTNNQLYVYNGAWKKTVALT